MGKEKGSPRKAAAAGGAAPVKKKLSPYNTYMKSELAKVKKMNPSLSHKDAFKVAAQNWASAPENPKNKK